ncbi:HYPOTHETICAL PROTEIN MUW33_2564B [Mycobacterium canetti]|nr:HYPOTHETICAL PROTEIN MUW33_2564B [Mycobacterium canetti]
MVSYIPTALNVSMGGIVGWRCVP